MMIAVIGQKSCDKKMGDLAESVGFEIAKRGHTLICGGMGGVMEAACRGAKKGGGTTVGILPGKNKNDANPHVDIAVVTAMSHARNAIIVRSADAVIAVGGRFGTLSEIGLALSIEKPVLGFNSWDVENVLPVDTPENALDLIEKTTKIPSVKQ